MMVQASYPPYSILMSVYAKSDAGYLRQSIDSMLAQTVFPEQFVIVKDGPLTPELDELLRRYESAYPNLFTLVQLSENGGIGVAARAGLQHCRNALVAKMDADDISSPERCALQLKRFMEQPELDILGTQIFEFSGGIQHILGIRRVPLEHTEILAFARRRTPFNNQTIMYKKQTIEDAGSYSPLRRCEDVDLFLRLLGKGARAANLDEALVYFRVDDDAYTRRGNWANTKPYIQVRYRLYRKGYLRFMDFLLPSIAQLIIFFIPNKIMHFIYMRFFRDTGIHTNQTQPTNDNGDQN